MEVTAANSSSGQYGTGLKTLGKGDFLRLLVTELSNQDPMQPIEDRDFIAQLAQFSSLEQMEGLRAENQKFLALSMLGKDVYAKDADGQGRHGVVDAVDLSGPSAYLSVGGAWFKASEVRLVTAPPEPEPEPEPESGEVSGDN